MVRLSLCKWLFCKLADIVRVDFMFSKLFLYPLCIWSLGESVVTLITNIGTVVGLLYYTLSFSDSINRYLMVMETLRKLSSKKISDF